MKIWVSYPIHSSSRTFHLFFKNIEVNLSNVLQMTPSTFRKGLEKPPTAKEEEKVSWMQDLKVLTFCLTKRNWIKFGQVGFKWPNSAAKVWKKIPRNGKFVSLIETLNWNVLILILIFVKEIFSLMWILFSINLKNMNLKFGAKIQNSEILSNYSLEEILSFMWSSGLEMTLGHKFKALEKAPKWEIMMTHCQVVCGCGFSHVVMANLTCMGEPSPYPHHLRHKCTLRAHTWGASLNMHHVYRPSSSSWIVSIGYGPGFGAHQLVPCST